FIEQGVSHRQRCRNKGVVWLLLAEWLKRVARLFSGSLCLSDIASYPLNQRYSHLLGALFNPKSNLKSSLSGMQQLCGLSVISFKSQLSQFGSNGRIRVRLCVYIDQQFSGFLQVTFGLVHAGF